MNSKSIEAKREKKQQRIDAGFVSKHYPDVESIIISMIYNQRGIAKPIHRIVNYSPDSYAFFRIDCLNRDCNDGGFDLTRIIATMIRNHRKDTKGDLKCENSSHPACDSDISYTIKIKFS